MKMYAHRRLEATHDIPNRLKIYIYIKKRQELKHDIQTTDLEKQLLVCETKLQIKK